MPATTLDRSAIPETQRTPSSRTVLPARAERRQAEARPAAQAAARETSPYRIVLRCSLDTDER